MFVLIYFDDLLIPSNSISAVNKFKASLSSTFHMKDFGVLKYFFYIEVAQNSTGIYLCLQKYTLEILFQWNQIIS